MTSTEFFVLLTFFFSLTALGAWLQWRNAPAAERRSEQGVFRFALIIAGLSPLLLVLNVFVPTVPPSPWVVALMGFLFLLLLYGVLKEAKEAIKGRHADEHRADQP